MDKKLLRYIRENKKKGVSKEKLYLFLLEESWKVDDINECYALFREEQNREEEKASLHKKTIHIIVMVGALLIGAGVFSFIASNWQYMSKPLKIGMIVIGMLISYLAGWHIKEKYNYTRMGNALIFLGAIIYGAGIFLVGQMFNMQVNWPDGFLLWLFGVLALVYALKIFELYYLAIILCIVALIGHPFNIISSFMGHSPYLLTSTILLIITTILLSIVAINMRKDLPEDIKKIY